MWPAYSSTIILIGVASRLAVFPVFLWAHNRERRVEHLVIPYLRAYRTKLEEKAQHEIFKANNDAARKYFSEVVKERLTKKRNELVKEHRCTPWVTMLVPPATQIPIFLAITAVFYRAASGHRSVLRDETFLTLSSLAHPDPTMTIPILLGIASMASIETSRWFITEEQTKRLAAQEALKATQETRGETVIQPSRYVKSVLRGLSVGRILLAALVPGCIELYWLSNATLGIFQNWTINWSIARRAVQYKAGSFDVPKGDGRGGVVKSHKFNDD